MITQKQKILDWKPKFSGKEGFKRGLNKTINWYSNKKTYQCINQISITYKYIICIMRLSEEILNIIIKVTSQKNVIARSNFFQE